MARAATDAFAPHDHASCRSAAIEAVRAECAALGLRLTPARACVLEALLETHRALTAYELLDRLREAGLGGQPPVAYRALDFLVAHGFAHRIERLSAFVACTRGRADHAAAFLICRRCRRVAETVLPRVPAGISADADDAAFAIERMVIEAEGLCAECRGTGLERAQ
jgi:Fur family transcriptional regulator, zinc uptake regulator